MSFLYEIFIAPIEIIYRAIYLGSLQFTHNYGLSILVLSCISAVAFIPLGRLAVGTQAREKKLQMIMAPQLARIHKESKGAERQRRINNLYKRYAYHPLLAVRSAFGVALQIPFLTGAYYMILGLTQLQGQPCLMIPDLSQPDGLLWGVNALPIVMTVVNITATLTTPGLTRKDTLQAIIIAFFFLALLYNAASALLIFWTMNNVFFLLQNLRLPIRLPRFRKPGFAQGGMNTVMAATMRSVYSLSCAGLAILIFLYVPFQTYASDPEFFGMGPLEVLRDMTSFLSLAFFMSFVTWLWFPSRFKAIPAFCALCAFCFAFCNIYIFTEDLGALDGTTFLQDKILHASPNVIKDFIPPLIVSLILAGLLFFKIRIQIGRILSISIFSIVLITAWNIAQAYTCIYEYQKSHLPSYAKGILSYSKSKENVIIIVMDMFTGGHIEKMIADPWFDNFKKTMDGFTWYPDTISASAVTIMSLPSIYGGHNYLPDNQNKEKSFTLNEKINKAFALLPRNFSQNGYHVHIINGLDAFNRKYYKNNIGAQSNVTTVAHVRDDFLSHYYPSIPRRSFKKFFFLMGTFQASPLFIKKSIYRSNKWTSFCEGIIEAHQGFYKEEDAFFRYALTSNITLDSKMPTVKIFYTMLSHFTWHFSPDLKDAAPPIVDDPYPETDGQLTFKDGVIPEHYYAERHLMRYISILIEHLKNSGIYDNTRIILVSDHGERDSPMVARAYNNGKEFPDGSEYGQGNYAPGRPHALLMVKEPGQRGPLRINNAFMSTADVPALALKSVGFCDEFEMYDPANVQTPRSLTHTIGSWMWDKHHKNTYIFKQYRFEGTLFDPSKVTLEKTYD